MPETKSYQLTINPVKNRSVYLWYLKVKEETKDDFSAIVRYALESYYKSGGQCTTIAKLHDADLPADTAPVGINIYIGSGTAAKLLNTMKANGIPKRKVIHAVLEGGIEFIPLTEKEYIYIPPKKNGYTRILEEMSDILQTKANNNDRFMEKEEPKPESDRQSLKPVNTVAEPAPVPVIHTAPVPEVKNRKRRAAALSGKRG